MKVGEVQKALNKAVPEERPPNSSKTFEDMIVVPVITFSCTQG